MVNRPSLNERALLVSEVTETLRALMHDEQVTQHELALALGVSDARVSQFLSTHPNLTLGTLADVGVALGVRFGVVVMPLEGRERRLPKWVGRYARLLARRAG